MYIYYSTWFLTIFFFIISWVFLHDCIKNFILNSIIVYSQSPEISVKYRQLLAAWNHSPLIYLSQISNWNYPLPLRSSLMFHPKQTLCHFVRETGHGIVVVRKWPWKHRLYHSQGLSKYSKMGTAYEFMDSQMRNALVKFHGKTGTILLKSGQYC